jgi:hypothetical protein
MDFSLDIYHEGGGSMDSTIFSPGKPGFAQIPAFFQGIVEFSAFRKNSPHITLG